MRKIMMLLGSVVFVLMLAVSPAVAHDWDDDGCDEDWYWCDNDVVFVVPFGFFDFDDFDDYEVCWWEWSSVFEEWDLDCD